MTSCWPEPPHECERCLLPNEDCMAIKSRIRFGYWMPMCLALLDRPGRHGCYVYGLYDLTVDLMYVGVTGDPRQRLLTHYNRQPWGRRVRYVSMEWRESRTESLRRESGLIVSERPLYNIAGVPC